MDKLKHLLESIKPEMSHSELDAQFKMIAHELLENHLIIKGNSRFAIREIEFYYHGYGYDDIRTGAKTWTLTIKRTCPAGQWWFHDYGMDLTFDSNKGKGFGGGILIAGIENLDNPGEIIERGSKVVDKLFHHWDAFSSAIENAYLERNQEAQNYEISERTTREINLDYDKHKSKWRFKTSRKDI